MESNNAPSQPVADTAIAPKKIGKMKGGYLVVVESFRMLGKNKSIMMFPLLSIFFELLAAAIFIAGYFFVYGFSENFFNKAGDPNAPAIVYACLFVFYITSVFIASFFQAGLAAVVSSQINDKKLSFNDGVNVAASHAGKILLWSFVAATVGVVLQMIANKNKVIGRVVANVFGFAWDIVTFFIVPILVLENETFIGSLKRSGEIFKNKWGQTLVANFSTGLFFGVIVISAVSIFLASLFFGQPRVEVLMLMIILLGVFIAFILVLSATIEGIYRVILYEYAAHDKLPGSFTKELIVGAIKEKK